MIDIKELKDYAFSRGIEMMDEEALEYIIRRVKLFGLNKILELGTVLGYTSIKLASTNKNVFVTSIEKDNHRFIEAVKNVNKSKLNDKVQLVFNDPLKVDIKEFYNLIMLDASNGNSIDLFEKYKHNLEDNGFIIVDNIDFHRVVGRSKSILNPKLKSTVESIEEFIEFLKKDNDFYIEFLSLGNGLAICQKKSRNF